MNQKTSIPSDWSSRPVQRLPQAAALTGLSLRSMYRNVKAGGELELVKLGERSSAITTASIIRFLEARGVEVL